MISPVVSHGEHRKTADPDRPSRFHHEAEMLAMVRHPGVVSLLRDSGDQPEEIVLSKVPGGDLRGRQFPAEEVAGIGAAVATTLADLHDLGVVYDGCSPEHILLGADGAPVLCSFGRAQFGLDERNRTRGQRGDVAALIDVLAGIADDDAAALHRLLRKIGRQRHPSARSMARLLAGVRGARLPILTLDPDPATNAANQTRKNSTQETNHPIDRVAVEPPVRPEPVSVPTHTVPAEPAAVAAPPVLASTAAVTQPTQRKRPNKWALLAAASAVASLIACAALVARPSNTATPPGCPGVDDGCRAISTTNGILTTPAGRWSLGEAGDIVVLGRWSCGPVALPALLRPSDGQVWVFDRWALPGGEVVARPMSRVPGAVGLAVRPERNGCDRIEVIGPRSERTTLDPS
jgi:hypothetical protein